MRAEYIAYRTIMDNKRQLQQIEGGGLEESQTSQVIPLTGFGPAENLNLSVTLNSLAQKIPSDKITKNGLFGTSGEIDNTEIRHNSFAISDRRDTQRRSRSRSRDKSDRHNHRCTCSHGSRSPSLEQKHSMTDRRSKSNSNDRVHLPETQVDHVSHAPIFTPHQMSLEGMIEGNQPAVLGGASMETKPHVTGSRRRSRRVVPAEAIIPLPSWAKIALAEKGSGRTAGRLHGIVRAWSEVLHLHRGVTTVAEAIDKIADVSKASRVQAFKYYRCLKWQQFPFDSPEARSVPMSKLRQGTVQLGGQTFSLAPEMLKAMDAALGREESVQIARDNLISPEWNMSDQVWSGPASYSVI